MDDHPVSCGEETMTTDKTHIARMKQKYVRVKKKGDGWSTCLQIDHQCFIVAEQATKKGAEWFGEMLARALTRVTVE